MLFPAAKTMDTIIGIDIHAVVGVPVHPYFGPIFLWQTPKFPMSNVFINMMPACTVGAMGYGVHIPHGIPCPPTPTNVPYWQRVRTNVLMLLVLTTLTVVANIAIAAISALIPKPKSAEAFINEVTGINTASSATLYTSIISGFSVLTMWQTWVKLLIPPLPWPGGNGSTAIGAPNVTVNGGPLAFVAPLMATSCSDIPFIPNGMTLGFSNVLVDVSVDAIVHQLLVNTARGAIQFGVQSGVQAAMGGAGTG